MLHGVPRRTHQQPGRSLRLFLFPASAVLKRSVLTVRSRRRTPAGAAAGAAGRRGVHVGNPVKSHLGRLEMGARGAADPASGQARRVALGAPRPVCLCFGNHLIHLDHGTNPTARGTEYKPTARIRGIYGPSEGSTKWIPV